MLDHGHSVVMRAAASVNYLNTRALVRKWLRQMTLSSLKLSIVKFFVSSGPRQPRRRGDHHRALLRLLRADGQAGRWNTQIHCSRTSGKRKLKEASGFLH